MALNTFFDEWKGDLEQIDDVCIIGVRPLARRICNKEVACPKTCLPIGRLDLGTFA